MSTSLLEQLKARKAEQNGTPVTVAGTVPAPSPAPAPAQTAMPAVEANPTVRINPPESVLAPAPAPTVAAEPPKRGRPKGSKNAPKEAAAEAPSSDKAIGTLYIDCYPQGVNASFADSRIDAAKKTVCELSEVGDYRYIEFGKGEGMVSEAFFADLESDPVENLVIYTSTKESNFLLSGLVARAGVIVRAR